MRDGAPACGVGVTTEDLGQALRRLRRLAGLTQEEPTERSSVSVDVIRQLEQQRTSAVRRDPDALLLPWL
ncbi:helix-turn-helix domain-containing protein [Streptomyces sp. NPDC006477]|uniref:helix-turn-helix domain-containing protein n=1 Tax=Streptomyces sp. NPDC006477 TaxID=3364747 RepID=UPI0036C16241